MEQATAKGRISGKINSSQLTECLEQMDFPFEGDAEGLIRSVLPAAASLGRLSLQDAIKGPNLSRDDSLAELEDSFREQIEAGNVPEIMPDHGSRAMPSLFRDDSLGQLKASFHNQGESESSHQGIADFHDNGGPSPPEVGADVPHRRRSIAGGVSSIPDIPMKPGTQPRAGSFSTLGEPEQVDLPHRRSSISSTRQAHRRKSSLSKNQDHQAESSVPPSPPEITTATSEEQLLDTAIGLTAGPVEVSEVPHRRHSVTVPLSWSQAAAQEAARAFGMKELEKAEVEAERQREESQKLQIVVSECLSWLTIEAEKSAAIAQTREEAEKRAAQAAAEAAAKTAFRVSQETAAREAAEFKAAEAAREAEDAMQLAVLAEEKAKAKEEALCNAALKAEEEKQQAAEEAAAKLKRAEAAHAAAEVEAVLRFVVGSIKSDEAIARAREEVERQAAITAATTAAKAAAEADLRVSQETTARKAAELKAAEAVLQTEEALRLVALAKKEACRRSEEEAGQREKEEQRASTARKALDEETRLLRLKLEEAEEKIAEKALEEEMARMAQSILERQHDAELEDREARLLQETKAGEATLLEAQGWKEKFEAMQAEREEQEVNAAALPRANKERGLAVENAAAEAWKVEEQRVPAPLGRHPLQSASVSMEEVDMRRGKPWWQCVACNSSDTDIYHSDIEGDGGSEATVSGMQPESRIEYTGRSQSEKMVLGETRSEKSDVCSIM